MTTRTTQTTHAGGMKTFVVIWVGQLISTLGSGLTGFGLSVWIFDTTGSATLFAITLLIWMLPNVALSPLAGMLADRRDRRRLMIFSDTGAGLSSLFVAVMLLTGELQVWHVYVAAFFNSAFSTAGTLYTLGALAVLIHPRIRRLEAEVPDALPDREEHVAPDLSGEVNPALQAAE